MACTNKDENDAKRYMTDPNGLGCVAMTCDGIVSRRYMTWRVIAWYRGGIWRDTIAHDDERVNLFCTPKSIVHCTY